MQVSGRWAAFYDAGRAPAQSTDAIAIEGAATVNRQMIESLADLSPPALDRHDAIIDVRSPTEYAADHLPGAINLPVLDDAERAHVGTVYVQQSKFLARRIGAGLVARNVARHLEDALADKPPKWRPLLYCWRGGMRSNAMATILSQIGWRVGVVDGGYRTWRRAVNASLSGGALTLPPLMLIDGQTGAAKTEILGRIQALGLETIDLEALAAHKGSVFGADPARQQPSQRLFESRLFDIARRLDPDAPVAIEAESVRIGRLALPPLFRDAMRPAARIIVTAPTHERARHVVATYQDFIAAPGAVEAALDRLRPFNSKEKIGEWREMAAQSRFVDLAGALMRDHYDPLYDRSRKKSDGEVVGVIHLDRIDTGEINRAALEAAALIRTYRI